MGLVTVTLDKVTNLIDNDRLGKSDPYVKFELEQDNLVFDRGYGKKESSHKSGTCNPEYDETFTFEDVPSLENMVLHIKVMDDDIGRDDKLGYCKIDLENLGLDSTPKAVEGIVDKKNPEGSICHPCKYLCACFCSFCKRDAVVYLHISYSDE